MCFLFQNVNFCAIVRGQGWEVTLHVFSSEIYYWLSRFFCKEINSIVGATVDQTVGPGFESRHTQIKSGQTISFCGIDHECGIIFVCSPLKVITPSV